MHIIYNVHKYPIYILFIYFEVHFRALISSFSR